MKTRLCIHLICALLSAATLCEAQISPSSGAPELSLSGHFGSVCAVAFSPDGGRIASRSFDDTIRIWDVGSGAELASLKAGEEAAPRIAFSPDGRRVAGPSAEHRVTIWDAGSGETLRLLEGPEETLYAVAYSPDGRLLAGGSESGIIIIWDTDKEAEPTVFKGHGEAVISLAFSPDGALLISGAADDTATIWQVTTQSKLVSLSGHDDEVNTVAFSFDGRRVATGSDDGTVKLWDVQTGKMLADLRGHEGAVNSVAFFPDSKRLVSGSNDTTIRVWNLDKMDEALRIDEPAGGVLGVAVSPDGKLVASAMEENVVNLWHVKKVEDRALYRDEAVATYQRLFKAARFLDRQEGLLANNVPLFALDIALQTAMEAAEKAEQALRENLDEFIKLQKKDNFKADNHPNYEQALLERDSLARNLLVMKALADFATHTKGADSEKAALASRAASHWRRLARDFISYYPSLANPRPRSDENEELTTWYRQLRFIARRNILTSEELLRAAPAGAFQPATDELEEVFGIRVDLLALEADYKAITKVCEEVAKEHPDTAASLARRALATFTRNADYAGRSDRARDAARSLRARDFVAYVQDVSKIKGVSLDWVVVAEKFPAFCALHRPVGRADMELLLAPLADRNEEEMHTFTAAMLDLLEKVEIPGPKGNESEKKIDGADFAAVIGQEYEALDGIITAWRGQKRDSWVADRLRAGVRSAWAQHQLKYVEVKPESTQAGTAGKAGAEKTTATDATGYRLHMAAWREAITAAAERALDDPNLDEAIRAQMCGALLNEWFSGLLLAATEPAYQRKTDTDLLEGIRAWVSRLPEGLRERVLASFAQVQLERLNPPLNVAASDRKDEAVKPQHRYEFVRSAASLAPPGRAEGRVFKGILEEYDQLRQGIRFHVVPEGEVYDQGKWAEGELPEVPVDSREFGLWFTIVHTEAAKHASGGFRRYTSSTAASASPDEYTALSETERVRYKEDFEAYLKHQFTEGFEVVKVQPVLKVEPRRDFQRADGVWFETPLYYAVIRVTGNVFPAALEPLRMDLDFAHSQGRVVLPVYSPRMPLKAVKGKTSHLREMTIRQELNNAALSQGELVLTIASESLGLPPEPRWCAENLPPEGFVLDESGTDSKIEVKSFPSLTGAALIRRVTTYRLDWLGSGMTTTFHFPSYPTAAGSDGGRPGLLEVQNFLTHPGQIKERPIPTGQAGLYGLPWRWGFASAWLSKVLTWGGAILVGFGLLLLGLRLARRRLRQPPKKPFPLTRPNSNSPLAAALFLRRLAVTPSGLLSADEAMELGVDVERLENLALNAQPEVSQEAGVLVDKWLQTAIQRFTARGAS